MGKSVQHAALIRHQQPGGEQASQPYIGDRALKRHEGGALMRGRDGAVMARVVLERAELSAMKRVNSR